MKLEVVLLAVSDVDRAKAFYENLGWRLDVAAGGFRGVQMTPHNSEASIIFGTGVTSARSGSADNLVLAVEDIDAARDDLIDRGLEVSAIFHYAGGPFNNTVENLRAVERYGTQNPPSRTTLPRAALYRDANLSGTLENLTNLPALALMAAIHKASKGGSKYRAGRSSARFST